MKISVADARAFAASLVAGADQAEKNGTPEFDLVGSLQALDNAARDDLQAAIEAAKQ